MQRVALVLERRLVERRVDEAAGVVPRGDDRAVDRAAIRMHVEHVHEHADLERVAVEIRIARLLDADDLAVGRRKHGVGLARHLARRIAEELRDEQRPASQASAAKSQSPAERQGQTATATASARNVQPSRAMIGMRVGVVHCAVRFAWRHADADYASRRGHCAVPSPRAARSAACCFTMSSTPRARSSADAGARGAESRSSASRADRARRPRPLGRASRPSSPPSAPGARPYPLSASFATIRDDDERDEDHDDPGPAALARRQRDASVPRRIDVIRNGLAAISCATGRRACSC